MLPLFARRCFFVLLLAADWIQASIREPWVEHIASFMSKEDCDKIIEEAESIGYSKSPDSIDYNEPRGTVSWQIDVVLEGMIEVPQIATLYEPYLPMLRDLVADRKFKMNNGDTSEPQLDWVFLRKYSADGERRMLKLHHDVNLFTVNIGLNDDFEGGGLFYHKNHDEFFSHGGNLPQFPVEKLSYEFLDDLKRQNTSEIVFPDQSKGDLLIHNNTLFHAIAPIEKGTRYSLIFFYDQNHPDVRKFQHNPVPVRVMNHFDYPVDLYVVDGTQAYYSHLLLEEELLDEFVFEGTGSHHYEIVDRKNGDVVFEFDIFDDKEEGEEHVIHVGPSQETKLEYPAIIENRFKYPVSLYWVGLDDDGKRSHRLIEETLEDFITLDSEEGHEFIVVNQKTDEIVHYFVITRHDEDEREFRITVGPSKQPPHKYNINDEL